MWSTVAEIRTPTTNVEIIEFEWPKPVEHTWIDPRPVMTLMCRPSGYQAVGRYPDDRPGGGFSRIGSVFFVPPNAELVGRGAGGGIKAARCLFDPAFYERTLGGIPRLSASQLRRGLDMQGTLLPSLLRRLLEEAVSPGFASAALAESLGIAMLIEWARQVLEEGDERNRRGRLTKRQLASIEDYVEGQEIGAPSVSDLAALCGLSERYFCRVFREETGQSVGRYVNAARIRRARRLLAESDLPLKEIAFRLGFANAANFSNAFRAATHQPPGAFRKHCSS